MTEPVLIDARHARDFLEVIAAIYRDDLRHPQYQAGAAEAVRTMRLYLDGLIEDPKADRSVAA